MPTPLIRIPASQALDNVARNRSSRWPDGRKSNQRFGLYATCVLKPGFEIERTDRIYTSGSCFAREIEKKLDSLGFDVPMRAVAQDDTGLRADEMNSSERGEILNKYVPQAMLNEMRWALTNDTPSDEDMFFRVGENGEDLWQDCHLHASLKPAPLARIKERRELVMRATRQLPECRVVVLTLGLVEAWFDRASGLYLNGIPGKAAFRLYPDRFELHVLEYQQILDSLHAIHALLRTHGHPDFKIIVTVSPVPMKATFTDRDAMIANTYSKSVLRSAAEAFSHAYENVNYFPSYENATLSERSVAYTVDNIHIQDRMVARIVSQFADAYVTGMKGTFDIGSAARTDATTPDAIWKRAMELAEAGNTMQAAKVLGQGVDTFGDEAFDQPSHKVRLMLGQMLINSRSFAAAEHQLRIMLEKCKQHPQGAEMQPIAWSKLAMCLSRQKKFVDAANAINNALALNTDAGRTPQYLAQLARAYRTMGEHELAAETTARGLGMDPGNEALLALQEEMQAR